MAKCKWGILSYSTQLYLMLWFDIRRPGHSGFTGGEIPNLWHDISVKRCQNEPDWLGWHFCYSQWDFPALMGLTLLSIWSFMIRHLPKVLCKPHYGNSYWQMGIWKWGSNPIALQQKKYEPKLTSLFHYLLSVSPMQSCAIALEKGGVGGWRLPHNFSRILHSFTNIWPKNIKSCFISSASHTIFTMIPKRLQRHWSSKRKV